MAKLEIKTAKNVAEETTRREGGKSQIKIGDAYTAINIVSDLMIENPEVISILIANGIKRKKKPKK